MGEMLKQILTSDAGSFGFVISVLGVIIWVVHFTTKKIAGYDYKTGKIDDIETSVNKKFDRIETKFNTIQGDIHKIHATLEVFKDRNNPLAQRQSPVKLTPEGDSIAKQLEANKMIINHWDFLKKEADSILSEDCNPYDIQVVSFKLGDTFKEFLNKEELAKVKLNAYHNGLDLSVYEMLFGIIIRDMILKERGYTTKEVDDFDPKRKKHSTKKK